MAIILVTFQVEGNKATRRRLIEAAERFLMTKLGISPGPTDFLPFSILVSCYKFKKIGSPFV